MSENKNDKYWQGYIEKLKNDKEIFESNKSIELKKYVSELLEILEHDNYK